MNDPERDTKFQGFAKALLGEMHDPIADYWREGCQEIIARHMAKLHEETKPLVHILDHATLPISNNIQIVYVKAEYDGKQYAGMLYPLKDEEDNNND